MLVQNERDGKKIYYSFFEVEIFLEKNLLVQSAIVASELQRDLNFDWRLILGETKDYFEKSRLGQG